MAIYVLLIQAKVLEGLKLYLDPILQKLIESITFYTEIITQASHRFFKNAFPIIFLLTIISFDNKPPLLTPLIVLIIRMDSIAPLFFHFMSKNKN